MILLLLYLLASPIQAKQDTFPKWITQSPSQYKSILKKQYGLYHDPSGLLKNTFKGLRGKNEVLCFYFLAANIPPTDRVSMTEKQLLTQIRVALRARSKFPWCKRLPFKQFLHYVLPYRSSQEPFEDFRARYWEELFRLIGNEKDAEKALYKINEWLARRITYKSTSRWDLGPLSTLKRGFGRCEEEMILLIAAARTVGLPVRKCYTPFWPFTNSNHAWVQALIRDEWHDVESAGTNSLDKAWFSPLRKRSAVLVNLIMGKYASARGEKVIRKRDTYTILGYCKYTKPLNVRLVDVNGEALKGYKIGIYVSNYAALRPLYSLKTDANGEVAFLVNPMEYYIFAWNEDNPSKFVYKKVTQPSKDTVVLKWDNPLGGEKTLGIKQDWIRVKRAVAGKRKPDTLYTKEQRTAIKKDRERRSLKWKAYRKVLEKKFGKKSKVYKALKDVGGNLSPLLSIYAKLPKKQQEDFRKLIPLMPKKDRATIEPEVLKEHLELAGPYRAELPDSIYIEYLVMPRIYYESNLSWRAKLSNLCSKPGKLETTKMKANCIANYVRLHCKEDKPDYVLGDYPNPYHILSIGRGSKKQIACLMVGLLRAHGIPARLAQSREWAEYYLNGKFVPLSFSKLKKTYGDKDAAYKPKAKLELRFYAGAGSAKKPTGKGWRYFYDFTLTHFKSGRFQAAQPDTGSGGCYNFKLIPRAYTLFIARRNVHGDSYIRAIPYVFKPNEKKELKVNVDFPKGSISPSDFCSKRLEDLTWYGKDHIPCILKNTYKKKPVLLLLFKSKGEASTSTVLSIKAVVSDLLGKGVVLTAVATKSETAELKKLLGEHCKDFKFLERKEPGKKRFGIRRYPSVLLIDRKGKLLLWSEGFNLSLSSIIVSLLDSVK